MKVHIGSNHDYGAEYRMLIGGKMVVTFLANDITMR